MDAIPATGSRRYLRSGLAVAGVLAAGALVFTALPNGVASPVEFSGMTRSATVKASRDATWYGQVNARGICALFSSCTSAIKTSSGYRLAIEGNVPGLGLVRQNVDATVVKKVRPRLVRMRLKAASDVGSVNATISLRLRAKAAQRTVVTVHVNKATGTGAMGTVLLPFLSQGLKTGLDTAAAQLNIQRKASGIIVQAKRKTKRVTVTVRFEDPGVQPTPTASGRLRILTKQSAIVCRAKVKKSRSTCTVRGTHKGKALQAVVTGTYTSGFQVWHSSKVRVTT
jgi:hypothetical protein